LVRVYSKHDIFIVFFFSSRRRHTRCYRDWSSDVCSSDLLPRPQAIEEILDVRLDRDLGFQLMRRLRIQFPGLGPDTQSVLVDDRSEERRVGKECRMWVWRYTEAKTTVDELDDGTRVAPET